MLGRRSTERGKYADRFGSSPMAAIMSRTKVERACDYTD